MLNYKQFRINEEYIIDPSPSGLTSRTLYDICNILVDDGGIVNAKVSYVINNNQFNCFWDIKMAPGEMNTGDYNMDCDDILVRISNEVDRKLDFSSIGHYPGVQGIRIYIGQYRELTFEIDDSDAETIEEIVISGVPRSPYDVHLLNTLKYGGGSMKLTVAQYNVLSPILRAIGGDSILDKLKDPSFVK